MVSVYRPDGEIEEKEAVDARECVKYCGYSYKPREPDDKAADGVDDEGADGEEGEGALAIGTPAKVVKKTKNDAANPAE